MIDSNSNSRAALLLAVAVTLLTMGLPVGTGTPAATAAGLSVPTASDAWLNRAKPRNNYGTATLLRAVSGESETLLRFNVSAWSGKSIVGLTLGLGNVAGDVSGLVVDRTESGWKELTVNWNLRPKTLSTVIGVNSAQQVTGGATQFNVKAAFPSGVVDRATVWLRIRNTKTNLVTFGSRESTKKPTLTLTAGPTPLQTRIKPIGDTWIDSASPAKTHGGAAYLLVDAQAKRDAFLKFDVSKWRGRSYSSLKLYLRIRTAGGAGVSIYRSGSSWSESTLNWKTRPASLGLLTAISPAPTTGTVVVDLSAAFADGLVSTDRFSIRIATTNSRGFDFSAREGATPAILEIVESPPTPPPTPSPTMSPAPTATVGPSPTSAPTSTPTAAPSSTPAPTSTVIATGSVCPTPIPTTTSSPTSNPTPTSSPIPTGTPSPTSSPGPTPSPSVEPLFYFLGHGTDHGVGMSQVGAKGRAQAGQTYSQILTFYYTGVDFTTVDGTQPIRVRLSDSFWPTATKPARVTGYIGGWQSDTFPGVSFPQGSYVQIAPNTQPTPSPTPDACGNVPVPTQTPIPSGLPLQPWTATAYDSTGAVIASAPTNDLTVTASDPEGVLRMAHRDEQIGYTTYRGSMRMVVMPTGLQTINILPMEQYLRGVVPAESPASWPIEAVKAQAVAARTYAWQRLKRTVNWDVLPDSANQNYGGWQHERARSDAAIIATANQVLTYKGAVISAVYHSASGGYTENSEYSFTNARGDPGNVVAYLRGKPDVDANGVPYDINASSYDWQSAQFTMSQLSTIFGRNTQTDVGDIYSIDYLRGVSGRVYQVVLTGSEGTKTVSGGRFKNIYNDNKMSGAKLLSAMFYLTPVPPPVVPSVSP